MKNTRRLLSWLMVLTAVSLFLTVFAAPAVAQVVADSPAPSEEIVLEVSSVGEAIVATLPEAIQPAASALLTKIPSWVYTALTVFGTLSLAWQALIVWWHKRVADTTSDADDKWTAKLEQATWFKIIDKIFYFGGYLGSRLGGKKL